MYNIKWGSTGGGWTVNSATVDLYVAPFCLKSEEDSDNTYHKVMMQKLQFWERFEKLKNRVCTAGGKHRTDFCAEDEDELFYGFTRKNEIWYSTSCTLNCWVRADFAIAPEVIRDSGIRRSDMVKDLLINLIPNNLWQKIRPKLKDWTISEPKTWNVQWAISVRGKHKEEEADRILRLIKEIGIGSKLYMLDLRCQLFGFGGRSSVEALAKALGKVVRLRKGEEEPLVKNLQTLNLCGNILTSEYIEILAPIFKKCNNLRFLKLSDNLIGDEGCKHLIKSIPYGIHDLDLSNNKIGKEGAEELTKLVERNQNLNITLEDNLEESRFAASQLKEKKRRDLVTGLRCVTKDELLRFTLQCKEMIKQTAERMKNLEEKQLLDQTLGAKYRNKLDMAIYKRELSQFKSWLETYSIAIESKKTSEHILQTNYVIPIGTIVTTKEQNERNGFNVGYNINTGLYFVKIDKEETLQCVKLADLKMRGKTHKDYESYMKWYNNKSRQVLTPGSLVVIVGVPYGSFLNGQRGLIIHHFQETDRYVVKTCDDLKWSRLEPAIVNIRKGGLVLLKIGLEKGSIVTIKGLQSKAGMRLNGKQGCILGYSYTGRYNVKVNGEKKIKNIKPEKLIKSEELSETDLRTNLKRNMTVKTAELLKEQKEQWMPEEWINLPEDYEDVIVGSLDKVTVSNSRASPTNVLLNENDTMSLTSQSLEGQFAKMSLKKRAMISMGGENKFETKKARAVARKGKSTKLTEELVVERSITAKAVIDGVQDIRKSMDGCESCGHVLRRRQGICSVL